MSTRIVKSIVFYLFIVFVKGQVKISQTPSDFVEGQEGNIICTTDNATEEIKITRGSTTVLTCESFSSTCNSSEEYQLSSSGNASVTLTISKLSSIRDKGPWTCQAHTFGSATLTLQINVPVTSVEIETKADLNLVDGVIKIIKCGVQPVAVDPPPVITWKIGGIVKSTSTSGTYSYKAAKADDTKTLECVAKNNFGPAKNDILSLNISYKPIVSIVPSTSPYNIIEGQDLKFVCNYEANPEPSAINVFRSDSSSPIPSVPDGALLENISRTSDGIYACTVTNEIGKGTSAKITVDVLYPPKIQLEKEYRVIENRSLSINCNVDSNPTANIVTWNKGNQRQLSFANIRRADSGVYTCIASNIMVPSVGSSVSRSDTETTRITVLYGPEISVLNDSIEVIEFSNLRTSCTVSSNPPSKIKWLSPKSRVLSTTNILELNNVNRTNTGIYTCQGTVAFDPTSGSIVTEIASKITSITVLHVPDKPTQPVFVNSTETTICVKWKPGFNGGKDQNFTVQYSKDNQTWVDSQQIPERTNIKVSDVSSQELIYCLRNLSPDTEYSVKIFPQNFVGKSEPVFFQPACCKPIRTQISAFENQYDSTIIGLAVGLGLVLVIAVLAILAAIFFYRRLHKMSKKNTDYSTTELAHRQSRQYADLRQVPDGGYANYGSEDISSESVYENQAAASKHGGIQDNERKYENFVDKSKDSRRQDHKKGNLSPKFVADDKNYENLPRDNDPNIYENYKGKQKT